MEKIKNIIIVGAGGLGREIYSLLKPEADACHIRIAGFVDDTLPVSDMLNENYPVPLLGSISSYVPVENDYLVLAIGDPRAKLELAKALEEKGAKFFSFIHPNAVVSDTAKIGKGVVIYPYCFISADSEISDFVMINCHSGAGHDVFVGDGSTICAHVDLTGHVKVGKAVFIGSHASILPNVEIGDYAKIGAGAIVVRRVKESATVYAQPARTL
ncbi:acetyltransferase [Undibacterium sp. Dicai25W]|uniref:acetyltransferase n=1 Tax=Undibacterium sp. Dicai25W TaxID=3413034 RepID=UPI003BF0402F